MPIYEELPPGTEREDGVRYIDIMRIDGSGTLPSLLKCISEQLMRGRGIRFATNDWGVVSEITRVSDRMGGSVAINLDKGGELQGIEALPAPEPSQALH
jgi:hypothetical protein